MNAHRASLLALLTVLIVMPGARTLSAQSVKYQATIDQKCFPQARVFQVPAGKTAMEIRPTKFTPGGGCPNGLRVKEPAWGISTGARCLSGNVFLQKVGAKGKVTETPTPLKDLKLKSGLWCLHVDGGMNALVEVTMSLVP